MLPDFLTIGRIVADETPQGLQVGGPAAYAALTAARLGLRAAIVTNPHTAFDVRAALPNVSVHLVGPPASTTFKNTDTPSGRVQFWYGSGKAIRPEDVPETWRASPIVHVAPVAQDVAPAIVTLFPRSLIGVSPQGWFRRRDPSGRVYPGPWRHAKQVLDRVDVVVASAEDYGPERTGVERYLSRAPVLVITQGARGARLRTSHGWWQVLAFPALTVDTTGAGDVFAAAFLYAFAEDRDPWHAACFASSAASLSVEGQGFASLPTRSQVLDRLTAILGVGPGEDRPR